MEPPERGSEKSNISESLDSWPEEIAQGVVIKEELGTFSVASSGDVEPRVSLFSMLLGVLVCTHVAVGIQQSFRFHSKGMQLVFLRATQPCCLPPSKRDANSVPVGLTGHSQST